MTNEQIAKSIADQMRFAKGGVRYEKLVRLVWRALNEKGKDDGRQD